MTKPDYRSCGAYNEEGTGITILNAFRSRVAEKVADAFLSKPAIHRPFPGTKWHLVYTRDFATKAYFFYRLGGVSQQCVMVEVRLKQNGSDWKVSGYGVSY